jgi:hypothetical protein
MQVRFIKAKWLLSLVILLLGYSVNTQISLARAETFGKGVLVHTFTPAAKPDFSMFARKWVAHGAVLVFSADGWAFFEERTYNWCGSGVKSPCDSIGANGYIRSGYQEKIQFSRVSGSVAYGKVTASNFHPVGLAVTVRLQENDTLLYAGTRDIALLCGPHSPPGECGA